MAWKVTTAPASEPLTATEVKNYLKVDYATDDTLIASLIVAARNKVEEYTGRRLMIQTITEKLDTFPSVTIPNPDAILTLSVLPLRSVTSIQYKDTAGASQTFASSNYIVDTTSEPPRIGLAYGSDWPELYDEIDAVTITYLVGYDDADAVPDAIKSAMYLMIGQMYETRTNTVKKLPSHAEWLLNEYRVRSF